MILRILVSLSVVLWVGGQVLFPSADGWFLFWGAAAILGTGLFYLGGHLEPRSLLVEIPLAAAFLLTAHSAFILRPQMRELKRKMALSEFTGSFHLKTMEFAFRQLQRNSVVFRAIAVALGLLNVLLVAVFLR